MAGFAASWRGKLSIGGKSYSENIDLSSDNRVAVSRDLAVALAAQLTTRTDNDTGVLTVATGHGITGADFVGFAWLVAGVWTYRYNVDVTAVTSNTISIDLGAGTNLPDNLTNGFVMVRQREEMIVNQLPSTWQAMNFGSTKDCLMVLTLDVVALDTPTYYPYILTKNDPLSFIQGIGRGKLPISGAAGLITKVEASGDQLRQVDFYNLDAAVVNSVTGDVLIN